MEKKSATRTLLLTLAITAALYAASREYLNLNGNNHPLAEETLNALYGLTGYVLIYNLPYYLEKILPAMAGVQAGLLAALHLSLLKKALVRTVETTQEAARRIYSMITARQALAAIFAAGLVLRTWNLMGDLGAGRGFSDGYNAYAAYEIVHGNLPYRDFVYTHLPLLPYTIAAAYTLFGTGLLQARALNLSLNLLSMVPLYLITKKWFGKNEALTACLLWAIYPNIVTTARYVGHESLMTLLILTSAWAASGKKSRASLFLSGAMLGLAILAKEPAALMAIPFFFYLRSMGKTALPWAWGLLAILLPALGYLIIQNGSGFLSYNAQFHASLPAQTTADKAYVFFSEVFRLNVRDDAGILRGILVLALAFAGMRTAARTGSKEGTFMLLWLASALILLLNKGFWWHYPLQMMPPLAIFLAIGLNGIAKATDGGAHFFLAALLLASMLVQEDYGIITAKDNTQAIVADAVKNITKKDDLVITSLLAIPLLAERQVPGELFEFGYQNAIITGSYAAEIAEKKNVSTVIMDARITDTKKAAGLEKFREYVQDNYREAWELNGTYEEDYGISVWERKT